MKDPQVFDYRNYSTGIEVLKGAIQQMDLVPLDEMESFLQQAIEATDQNSELSRKKIKAARSQLVLIDLSKRYISEVRGLLGDEAD